MSAAVWRRLVAEFTGTGLLVAIVVGSGIAAADIVITMGCGDACPVYPGKRYLDWQLPDPAGLDLGAVRTIRDQIRELVTELVREVEQPSESET
jgi:arsenate reductase (thioredoxin)